MFYNYILQAGIDSDKLTIALEPEAAAIYVKHLPVERRLDGEAGDVFKTFAPGSKYIVVDAGGMRTHMRKWEIYIHNSCILYLLFIAFLEILFFRQKCTQCKFNAINDCFVFSISEEIENNQRFGLKSYPTPNHGR